jgi:hypothetical protein
MTQMVSRRILTLAAGFNSTPRHVGYVRIIVTLEYIFSEYLGFPANSLSTEYFLLIYRLQVVKWAR